MAENRNQVAQLAQQVLDVSNWLDRHHNVRFASELGLTPASARALLQLDPDQPVPTRALASMLGCDPSNVTSFVDRLETAGLIERHVDEHDRRIKTLVVTPAGRQMLAQVDDIRGTDSPPLQALTAAERETLQKLLGKAWTAAKSFEADICAQRTTESR
ncbi:MarR family winged helix-turn-helix transcriptional regulator [Kribbella deserti]|uniref:MarR family winged helix-turn-helix transcriptional regulator n=1 Tax=Kribbella deserti TaxID=1926257 RepID=A0ABV6QRW5_9ACTN